MNDDPKPLPAPTASAAPPRLASRAGWWLALASLLILLSWTGWLAWDTGANAAAEMQDLERQLAAARAEALHGGRRLDALEQAGARQNSELSGLSGRVAQTERAAAQLSEGLQGGRSRFQLLAAEQLLLAANERLLLAHDIAGAAQALRLAEARLASGADPRTLKLRQVLAGEIAALAALPQPDRASATLALGGLVQAAETLPLASHAPQRFEAAPAPAPPAQPGASGWQRLGSAVQQALASVFSLRRDPRGATPLLAPEQAALVRQILALKLESARFALLRGEAAAYRDALAAAAAWLTRYYHSEAPAVRAAQAEAQRLAQLEFFPRLPDISGSLALLRARLEAAP